MSHVSSRTHTTQPIECAFRRSKTTDTPNVAKLGSQHVLTTDIIVLITTIPNTC